MPLNLGYIGCQSEDGDVQVLAYYDQTFQPAAGQTLYDAPLINGPRGYCLDVRNVSGRKADLIVDLPGGQIAAVIGKGDPVTTGTARSRTAAQVQALGATTRKDVPGITLSTS